MSSPMSEAQRLNQASEWLQRLHGAPRDEALVAQWTDWCHADPQNLIAFERIEAVWNAIDSPAARHLRSKGDGRATGAPGSSRSRLPMLAWSIAATLLLTSGIAIWWWFSGMRATTNYQTEVAQLQTFRLEDGTELTFGPGSYAYARFTPAERRLILVEGQAYFDVAKDSARPFRVIAADKAITVLGTKFDARLERETLQVAVIEGKVAISDNSAKSDRHSVLLAAGEQTTARINGAIAAPVASKTVDPTAWRKGQLQYIDESLSEVIADVNRYSSKKIVLTQPELRDRLYTGTVYRDRIDEWVRALEEVFPIQAEERDGRILLQQKER